MRKISNTSQGLIYGVLAYSMWGVFPLFFNLLHSVPPTEILLHRVIWSFVFVSIIILILQKSNNIILALKDPGLLKGLAYSSLLVSFNWLVYIWSVSQGRVIESSLGYFLTPLVSVFLARVILKEQLNSSKKWAILLAATGIVWLIVRLGYLPWISLALAISFGLYGLVRKQLAVDTLTGLTLETAILLPFALIYWAYLGWSNTSIFGEENNAMTLLLITSGIVTALPLLLFASAAKKLSLSAIGFMMYINPTLQFIIAIFVLNEKLNINQLIGFCFIWCALIIFIIGSMKSTKNQE